MNTDFIFILGLYLYIEQRCTSISHQLIFFIL